METKKRVFVTSYESNYDMIVFIQRRRQNTLELPDVTKFINYLLHCWVQYANTKINTNKLIAC